MLDFVDRFAEARFTSNKRLRLVSIWIGSVADETSLTTYLSAGAPEEGRFVRDMGEDWLDHDFLATGYRSDPAPIDRVVDDLAQELGCPEPITQAIMERCRARGVTEANTTVCLMQHTYDGNDSTDFSGLRFVGSYEYDELDVPNAYRYEHLFAGVAATDSVIKLGDYALDGELVEDTGLSDREVSFYGTKLAKPPSLTPGSFFASPIVAFDIVLGDSAPAVDAMCEQMGIEVVNAFISVRAHDDAPLEVAPGKTFCGLRYLGVFRTQVPRS